MAPTQPVVSRVYLALCGAIWDTISNIDYIH
jgi:hypothetical protein